MCGTCKQHNPDKKEDSKACSCCGNGTCNCDENCKECDDCKDCESCENCKDDGSGHCHCC